MRFESIAERLLKAGVAPRHVTWYVGELKDHFEEIRTQLLRSGCSGEEAHALARARLGDENELVLAMLEQPGVRAWSTRMPWLVFSLVPTVIALALFFVPLAVLNLMADFGSLVAPQTADPASLVTFARYLMDGCNLILAPALSAVFAVMVARQRLHFLWALLAAVSIAVLDLRLSAKFNGAPGGYLLLNAALWFDHGNALTRGWLLGTAQAVLTLLPATIALSRRSDRSHTTAAGT
jgi:hypothetical protein